MRKLLFALLLFGSMAHAQEVVKVVFDNGDELEVPDGEKVVFVRTDAPFACVAIEILGLTEPVSECAGLTVSPGCGRD